jgi:glucosamine-6-phosphate deaminase
LECARYDAVIKRLGGIDVQLLGIGHNGHIGFNEPGAVFIANTHVAELSGDTIKANGRFFENPGSVPVKAYTVGIKTIMQAKKVLMIASGANKAGIIKRAFFDGVTPGVPASILQLHGDFTLIGDPAALSEI